jgi:hypothetical protein
MVLLGEVDELEVDAERPQDERLLLETEPGHGSPDVPVPAELP